MESTSSESSGLLDQIETPAGRGFVCVPMKTMGQDVGCVFFHVDTNLLPLSKANAGFFTTMGRHVAGDVKLMRHLEEHAVKEETLEKEFQRLKAQVSDQYHFQNLIGKDESMKKVFRILEKVKDMDTGLLIATGGLRAWVQR